MLFMACVLLSLKWRLTWVICGKDGHITHSSKVRLRRDNQLVMWLPPAGWPRKGAGGYSSAHRQQFQCCRGGCTGRVCCSSHPWKRERDVRKKNNMRDRDKVVTHRDCSNCMDCLIMLKAGKEIKWICTGSNLLLYKSTTVQVYDSIFPLVVSNNKYAKNPDHSAYTILKVLSDQHYFQTMCIYAFYFMK